jgi:hypothetical protein
MPHDGHEPGESAPSAGPSVHARTDPVPAVRSVETTPKALYRWQIALLQARLDAQRSRAQRAERDRQHVIDRYEGLLDHRPPTDELYTDGGRPATSDDDQSSDSTAGERALERVRSLF